MPATLKSYDVGNITIQYSMMPAIIQYNMMPATIQYTAIHNTIWCQQQYRKHNDLLHRTSNGPNVMTNLPTNKINVNRWIQYMKCMISCFSNFLGPRVLSQVHQVEQPREGGVQAGRQQGGVPALGHAQEQARHELWDHGQGTEVRMMGWWHWLWWWLLQKESQQKQNQLF